MPYDFFFNIFLLNVLEQLHLYISVCGDSRNMPGLKKKILIPHISKLAFGMSFSEHVTLFK